MADDEDQMTGHGLNLGCGNKIIRGAVNHDIRRHRPEVDIEWDLNKLPWPWEDNEFDRVLAWAVLEHLEVDLLTSMNELWRITVPGGVVSLKLPYWGHARAYADPTHRFVFDPEVMDTFDPTTQRGAAYSFYTDRKWKVLECVFVNEEHTSFSAKMRKVA